MLRHVVNRVEFKAKDQIQLGKTQRVVSIDLGKMFEKNPQLGISKDWTLTQEFVRLKNSVADYVVKKLGMLPIQTTFEVSCTVTMVELTEEQKKRISKWRKQERNK